MEKLTKFQKSLKELRLIIPHGAIAEMTDGSKSKEVIMRRMFARKSVKEMTPAEVEMLKIVIKKAKEIKTANAKLENDVNSIVANLNE